MIPALEIIIRVVTLLLLLYFMIRWLGKKHLTQMTIFEYISGIVLGGAVAIHISSNAYPLFHGMIAIISWTFLIVCIDTIALKSKRFRDFVHGQGKTMIDDGSFIYEHLKNERMSKDELLESLRTRNIDQLSDVEFAQLEPSGKLNVRTYSERNSSNYSDEDLKSIQLKMGDLLEEMKHISTHSKAQQLKNSLKQLDSIHQTITKMVNQQPNNEP